MAPTSSTDTEIKALKVKLETAIKSRADLQSDFQYQTKLLTDFISKLSQTSKGMDVLLDNKLALFRGMLNKSASISDIEKVINDISKLLRKHSRNNETNIIEMHQQMLKAGKALQAVNGLPPEMRRQLRALLKESEDVKDALIQYVPILGELLKYYQIALKAKTGSVEQFKDEDPVFSDIKPLNKEVIEKVNKLLSSLKISSQYKTNIKKIREEIKDDMANDELLECFLEIFDVISQDLAKERSSAKVFLSTLSDTLATVQSAVKTTISTSQESQKEHDKLNSQLQNQISEMSQDLDQANSLTEIQTDINAKLQAIASTLEQKTTYELCQNQLMQKQLAEMKSKVDKLEEQSRSFEKRIQEQQAKSMQDALTKLANRASFDDFFAKEMVRFHHNKFELAIAVIDLDDFKRINDTYGHTAGDKTLQVIANTLKKQLGSDAFVARYGGEEFVAIFSKFNNEQVVEQLNNLRKKVARLPFKFKNNKVSITLSIGITMVNSDDNVHLAFERADTGLYQAKEQGKNRVINL